MLALVAVCALAPVYKLNAQDNSRLCLSQALAHGHLSNDGCFGLDHALYKGHEYTDKAPGLSLVELPLAEALRLPPANKLPSRSWKVWVIRLLTSGIVLLALALVVGRVAEGLAPGYGSIVLVTFALGTLFAPFAAMNFDQVPAAALGFGAFLLAWRRKPLAAGLLAGTGVFFEYEAGAALIVVGAYLVFTTRSWRAVATYAAGTLPGLLGARRPTTGPPSGHPGGSRTDTSTTCTSPRRPAGSSASTFRRGTRRSRSLSGEADCSSRRPSSSRPPGGSASSGARTARRSRSAWQ